MNKNFEIIARAIILDKNKVLVCHSKSKGHYFLPGGHVEFGEESRVCLVREIKEEIGVDSKINDLVGIVEAKYIDNGKERHELNMIFSAQIENTDVVSKENHINFEWVEISKLNEINLLPKNLPNFLIDWTKNNKIFYFSSFIS